MKRQVVSQTIIYSKIGNRTLKMTLYQPILKRMDKAPIVLLIHGGAWFFGSRLLPRWYAKSFARAGFLAATIDYRKMPRYPFPACIHDAKAAVRWLRVHGSSWGGDPEKIVAMGESAGGHIVLMLALTTAADNFEGYSDSAISSAIQAAVALYPPTDLRIFGRLRKKSLKTKIITWFMAHFLRAEKEHLLKALYNASPIKFLHSNSCPILLFHGTHDSVVPFKQSREFYETASTFHFPIALIPLAGKGHAADYFDPKLRRTIFEQTVAFLLKYL